MTRLIERDWSWQGHCAKLLPVNFGFRHLCQTLQALPVLWLCVNALLPAHAEVSATRQPFPGIAIHSETRTNPPTRMFVAEIDLTNPRIRVRVSPGGPDPDGPGQWQTTLMRPTSIATRDGFDLVVNGDFFRARNIKDAEGALAAFRSDVWSAVSGVAVSDGKTWSTTTTGRPCLVVETNRSVSIKTLSRPDAEARDAVSGNTILVADGKAAPHVNQQRHPRTAAGLDARRSKLILVVVDGRKPGIAAGMTYDELAAEMIRLGCHDALNLDGGGSSVMAVRDTSKTNSFQILNDPTDGRERAVANVLGISVSRP